MCMQTNKTHDRALPEQNADTAATLSEIKIDRPPKQRSYRAGELFDDQNMAIQAIYSDGSTKNLELSACEHTAAPLQIGDRTVEIAYSENGIRKSAAQPVFVTRPGHSDKYLSNSLTRAGTGSVDLYSKNILFAHSDIAADTLHLPFSVSHTYSAERADENDAYCGCGWQTNFHQRIVSPTATDDNDAAYIWIDGSGRRNKIIHADYVNNKVVYALDDNRSTKYDPSARTLTDMNGNQSKFNADGWLIEQSTPDGYKVTITYISGAPGKISLISEGSSSGGKKEFKFTYTGSLLNKIAFESEDNKRKNYVLFSYDANDRLTKISYETANGKSTLFTYDSIGILASVTDPTGHKLLYSYDGDTVTVQETPGGITKHSDLASNAVAAPNLHYRTWTLKFGGNTRVTHNGETTVVGFSAKNKYTYSFTDRSSGNDLNKLDVTGDIEFQQTIDVWPNQKPQDILTGLVKKVSSVSGTISKNDTNLVSEWTYDRNPALAIHSLEDCTSAYVDGEHLSKEIGYYPKPTSFHRLFATANVSGKSGYIVSAFVKAAERGFECALSAVLYDKDDNIVDYGIWELTPKTAAWQPGAVCLDDPEQKGTKIKVMITAINGTGCMENMYVDAMRVVEGTFNKAMSKNDDPSTADYYEKQKQTFGTKESSILSYQIVDTAVKTHLLSQTYTDQYGNSAKTTYTYDPNNGKLLSSFENGVTHTYNYQGYMGELSSHKRAKGGINVTDSFSHSISGRTLIKEDARADRQTVINLYTAQTTNEGPLNSRDLSDILYYYSTQNDLQLIGANSIDMSAQNNYEYTDFLLTKVTAGNNTVYYSYDGYGELLQVNVNGVLAKRYAYRDDCNYNTSSAESAFNYEEQTVPSDSNSTYSQKVIYNEDGLPLKKQEKNGSGAYETLVTLTYASADSDDYKEGELKQITDTSSGEALTQTFSYYKQYPNIVDITYSGARSGKIHNEPLLNGKPFAKQVEIDEDLIQYLNYYTPRSDINPTAPACELCSISCIVNGDTWRMTPDYGVLNLPAGRTVYNGNDVRMIKDAYTYNSDYRNISKVAHTAKNTLWATEEFAYDEHKRISEYTDVLGKTHRYLYDELGRLKREDNEAFGTSVLYTYNSGNIASITRYPYTSDEFPSDSNGTLTFHYERNSDRILYLSFDGVQMPTISYDSAGNPLLWNDSVLEWNRGRQLVNYGDFASFTYDAGGVRQSKTANGVTTSYFTEGNRIHKEERSDGKTLIYAYDESGIASITYNGTLYFVQKNFQGDIVALVNQSGNVVAKYVYDAWGNGKVCNASGTENTSRSFIGNINPFRYRGYYYDVETGLYYLQTRYYDPQAGRFLSPDSVDYIAPDIIGGLNLYAYCNNNPVMYSDPEGTFVWALIMAGIGAAASVIGRAIGDLVSREPSTWQEYVGSAISGAVSGALAATGVGLAAAAVVGSVAGDTTTWALNVATGTETRSLGEVGRDMLENAAFSAMFSVGGNAIKSMKPDVLKPLIKETAVTVSAVVTQLTNKIKSNIKKTLYRTAFDWVTDSLGRLIC